MKDRFGFDWSQVAGKKFWRAPHLSRRMLFRHAASALGGYFLMPQRPGERVARAAASTMGTAENCILVFLTGAPSHVDTFDLKEGAWTPAYFAPETIGGVRWPRGLMPRLTDHLDTITIGRSLRAYATAHGLAQSWVQIGRNPIGTMANIAPHIGSIVSAELAPSIKERTLPVFLHLNASAGPGAGYLPPDHEPFFVTPNGAGLPNTRHPDGEAALNRRYGLQLALDTELIADPSLGAVTDESVKYKERARRMMYNADIDSIFTSDAATRATYGNSQFGNACIAARNLLQRQVGTRFVQISFGSWDHHVNIYAANQNLQAMTRQLDQGLAQLLADLKSSGQFDKTLIVVLGEFGRTVAALNSTAGRDHHPQQSVLFAGARTRGGRALGATNERGDMVVEPGWDREREMRPEDIEATIYSALGIDWTTIRRDDPLGRGFEYVPFSREDRYGPIHRLWS